MKTVSCLVTAFGLFAWAFVNLVSNTLIFKQVDGNWERIWISVSMFLTGVIPLCIAIWLVLSSGLFPSQTIQAEIIDEAPGQRSERTKKKRGRS